jgi:hypothetical protein
MLETLAALLECLGYRTHPLGDLPHRPTVTSVWAGGYIPARGRLEASHPGGATERCVIG